MHEYYIDAFAMGDDREGKFDFLKEEGAEVVYLPRYLFLMRIFLECLRMRFIKEFSELSFVEFKVLS